MKNLVFSKNNKRYIFYFAAIAGAIGYLENILPKPMIFIKIGLSNIPILLVMDQINIGDLFFVILIKLFLSNFFSGYLLTPSFLLSLTGNLGAFIALIMVRKIRKLSLPVKSIFISFFSNLTQTLFYAFFLLNDLFALKSIVFISGLSVITGLITGSIAYVILKDYLKFSFI